MFEKFNDTARATILMAKDIAVYYGRDHISTGHLLLAVIGHPAAEPRWRNWQGTTPNTAAVITALGTTPEAIIDQTVPALTFGTGSKPGHLPFTPNMKQALEFALRSSMTLGDNHIGPEHLLAGLARTVDLSAGIILARLGITDLKVHAAIQDSTPAPAPTAARICNVYLPVGKSIFKNGAKIYPDLGSAQAAHPGVEIAPFAFQLHDGEFFDVCTLYPKRSSWGKFASYPDAFAAALELKDTAGSGLQIHIMVPTVTEMTGKNSRGHDVVLGRSADYTSIRMMTRLLTDHPDVEKLAAK
ncbi:Clp protease N-terminal domain-containing protein [Arthrobacter sp. UYCo732]|uniref:Clp protease N-terminal domain-containing protein n=1 Tax=Arthrobacter sp. UYCo732 TaxID=3156336 RepID=UPI00339201B4